MRGERRCKPWRGDRVTEARAFRAGERFYLPGGLALLLQRAGFVDIHATGDYTDEAPADRHRVRLFCAPVPFAAQGM